MAGNKLQTCWKNISLLGGTLLLLVLALSRPYWQTGSGGWFGGEPRAGVVLAIDSSFSMGHGSEGTSRFDRALEQAKIISESIRPGDPVSLVLMGGQDEVLVRNMAFDQERFVKIYGPMVMKMMTDMASPGAMPGKADDPQMKMMTLIQHLLLWKLKLNQKF